MTSGKLAALSVLVALGAVAAYALLLRVPVVRNHPEGYVIAFALAAALAALAVTCAQPWRRLAWLALGLSRVLLIAGAWFNFVGARVPDTPTVLRVGARPPDFTLPDAAGRPVSLADAALWPGARGRRAGWTGRSAPGDGGDGSLRDRALVLAQPELSGPTRPRRRPARRPFSLGRSGRSAPRPPGAVEALAVRA
jgi:hypothetical protein